MDGSLVEPLALGALLVAMIVTVYDMRASLRPAACPECGHCREVAEREAALQERLAREYAKRNHLDDDDDRRIG
jgi:MinD superfamily P-loop ATPase